MTNLEGKVAIVTGAGGGLGLEISRALAAEGVRLALCDLQLESCEQTAALCRQFTEQVVVVEADVTNAADMAALVDTTVREFGTLDYACNNAGVEGPTIAAGDLAEADWHRVIAVNLTGVWLSMKYQLKYLSEQGKAGSIVNVSSSMGLVAVPGLGPYVASKHGVIGLTKSAALDYAEQGIRINALCPGAMHTPLIDRVLETHPETVEGLIQATPMKRFGNIEDVSNAVKWLLSDLSGYMTGQSLVIDGGYTSQ